MTAIRGHAPGEAASLRVKVLNAEDDDRHFASAHPGISRLIEVLAEIAIEHVRSGK